ncbi:MAG TPA: hypothetical protein VK092_08785, partial [Deinococcales bacterium]|nr:hypothetical protein [Deinococcales bacterium]
RFLQDTRIDELRPESDLSVTAPGKYGKLREQIRVHRYLLEKEEGREVGVEEAAGHWHDTEYLPVVREIRRHDLLEGFEGRTETDLYLWLSEHQGKLRKELGFRLPSGTVAQAVADPQRQDGPAARLDFLSAVRADGRPRLYRDVLLGLHGSRADGSAFRRALEVVTREGGDLYVVTSREAAPETEELAETARARGVEAQFVTEEGNLADGLLERSRYSDLLVLPNDIKYRQLVRRCRRPLLLVRSGSNVPRHVLLAFDGRRRSEEAMFHAAYLQLAWDVQLSVVSVAATEAAGERTLDQARRYLDGRGVTAGYHAVTGPVTGALLSAAARLGCNMLALGSYKYSAWLETVLGGIPDELMRESDRDLLIC